MSARVNLLPREYEERAAARRTALLTGVALAAFVVFLGLLYALKLSDVAAARAQRDIALAEVQRLQGEVAQLVEFQQLADRLEARNNLLASAMAAEISWARVLNDVALSFAGDASLNTLTATAAAPNNGARPGTAVDLGTDIANVTYTGYSVARYAPGVETALIRFDEVRSFFNVFLSSAGATEIGTTPVTDFSGSVELGEEAFTHRYDEGLPAQGPLSQGQP